MLIGREYGSGDTPATKIGSSVSQRRWDLEATKPWFPMEEGFTRSDWCTFTPWGLKAVRFRADPSDSVGKFKGVREKRVRDPLYWKGMYDYLDVWKPHRLLYILYISYIIIINYIYIIALDSTALYDIVYLCVYIQSMYAYSQMHLLWMHEELWLRPRFCEHYWLPNGLAPRAGSQQEVSRKLRWS